METETETEKAKILIVDDMPDNIKLLVQTMSQHYDLLVANEGEAALQLAAQEIPDLILLDVMMPGMDGYTVCRCLKAEERTRQIPVIFVTAMGSETDETAGLQIGAVDYITKPFRVPVVLSRVAAHLALHHSYRQLEQQYATLREMEQLRKDVEAIVRHDMKSPIDGIVSCASVLLGHAELPQTELRRFLKAILDAARQLREMVNLSLNLVKMEQGQYEAVLQSVDLLPIIRCILVDHQGLIRARKSDIHLLVNGVPVQERDRFMVQGDDTLCYTMIANLFRNALEASASGQAVRISLQSDAQATIAIHNQGVVPEAVRARFFDKYVTHGKLGGTGLGTYSARLMAETQKGRISLESSEAEGTTLCIILPRGEEDAEYFDRR